ADRAVAVDLDVPDVPGAPVGPPVHLPVQVDPAPDARTDLDEEQVVDRVGDSAVPLADGHDVDVVVHHDGAGMVTAEQLAHRVPVPAGHDRRRHRDTVAVTHRPGHADPDGVQPLVGTVHLELGQDLVQPVQDHLRAGADVGRLGVRR